MTAKPRTAREVSEYLLDRTGRALMTGDVDLFESCMHLPQLIETFDGKVMCNTSAHFREIFASVRHHFCKSGVTEMVRHCVAAEFRNPDTVEATHEARLLSGNTVIQPAYPVFSILKRIDGDWKITFSMYAITDAPEHCKALTVPAPEVARASRSVPANKVSHPAQIRSITRV